MLPAEFDVTDRKVLVTGAGRGIGKGIAQVLAEAGADVAINALTERYVAPLAAEIATATGRTVIPVVGDVTKADSAQRVIDDALARFGQLKEVGYLALYLASPASDYMTGQMIVLDGGMSL